MMAVEAGAVDYLENRFEVGIVEKPEVARVTADRDGGGIAAATLEVAPESFYAKSSVAETERGVRSGAASGVAKSHDPDLAAVNSVVGVKVDRITRAVQFVRPRAAYTRVNVLKPPGAA